MAKTYHHGDLKSEAVKKAVEIIQKKGEVDFTLREIAQSLKVSHTAVYRHFTSKQDLLSYIAEEGFRAFSEKMMNEVPKGKTVRQKLRIAGKTYIEFALNNVGHYRSMFHQELRCATEQRPELEQVGAEAFMTLMDLISEGMKNQVFKKDDPRTVARFVWSSIHGFSILLLDGQFESLQSKASIQDGIDHHLEMIERALLK
ncbi:TetR family transcriptional regulator [Bdellovibrio bacteriovorus]|uniref:TetR family transcriptional regulator n=1 Tax=Bdellovibrio bacteriovorus TaxID=959 RepID=A0A150WW41_BDEBC|nr:TetR/AcrR family transcriptional regulator [Bdellovibrio bacteriovorus]KYG70673.1 TetR family transcriptional regulator [Bdellovibrio bacteriovorus]